MSDVFPVGAFVAIKLKHGRKKHKANPIHMEVLTCQDLQVAGWRVLVEEYILKKKTFSLLNPFHSPVHTT